MKLIVDQCPNFKGNICTKCGRMLPAKCKAQEDMEEKARLFDELMAKQAAEAPGHTDLMVTPESIEDLVQEEPKEVVKKTQVPLPKRLKK